MERAGRKRLLEIADQDYPTLLAEHTGVMTTYQLRKYLVDLALCLWSPPPTEDRTNGGPGAEMVERIQEIRRRLEEYTKTGNRGLLLLANAELAKISAEVTNG